MACILYDPGDRIRVRSTGREYTVASDAGPDVFIAISVRESNETFARHEVQLVRDLTGQVERALEKFRPEKA